MTTVVVLIAAPPGLRGHLTRWFVEVAPGTYVGAPNSRIRDSLWNVLADRTRDGQAVMIEPATTEQGWAVRTAGRDRWTPVDFDGLTLMARPRSHVAQLRTPRTK
ncbi:type I-E CRISPR-associated endoribonuclease Cas2 [Streptomyces sp. ISL-22]|uniref:type I-E CRISPR-associated endoribonuclease Cas2e n=1 Tax=unclassified Streptomyces TaxID=2593676 RepID=UPI001BECDAF2|nr:MULTISPECIES: type I-E CRISPR-associated endoribonuclease Cas2e [unclassified Streptomyces]MBT2423806.1 type I-E CRISPR-associated endoribonuclease Cas2 [Streptomyces sp. ISL-24]MBT2433526.1 type I-E CRISPR-associated endoribonuclease Cas2 [Streptomyces sp. ISL-22]